MRRPHVYKILITIIIIIIISATAASLLISYLNNTFIPIRLKDFVTEKLTEHTKHTVTIDSLRFSLKNGFILKDIKMYKNPEDKDAPLFKADSAFFQVFIIPSFKKQRVIIPSINLSGAYLNLARSANGDWNIASMLQSLPDNNQGSRIALILKEFSFNDSRLLFSDSYQKRLIIKEITSLDGTAGLSLPNKLSIRCNGKIDNSTVYIAGKYAIKQKELSFELKADNVSIADYADVYLPADIGYIRAGIAAGNIKGRVSSFRNIEAKGAIDIKGLDARIKETGLTGNCRLEGNASLDIEDPRKIRYSLEAKINDAEIANSIELLSNITGIKGALSLTEKAWSITDISCLFYGSLLNLSGEIKAPHEDFIARLNLRTDLSLKNISDNLDIAIKSGEAKINANLEYKKDGSYNIGGISEIKELHLQQNNILLNGDFIINGEAAGRAGDWKSSEYKGKVDFNNAGIKSTALLPFISKATGQALFSTKSIVIKKLIGTAAETEILLNASLDYNKKDPDMSLHLETGELSIARLISTLPARIRTRFKDINAEGTSYLDIDFKGAPGKPETYDYTGSLLLKQGMLNLKYWPYNISEIDCKINFKDQQVEWEDLAFNLKGERYTSDGKLYNFASPAITASIRSDTLNAACETKTGKDGVISVSKLEGQYRNSSFSFKGQVRNIQTTYADIKGNIYFNLKDAPYIFTKKNQLPKGLKPNGTIKLTIDMKGPLQEPAEWTLFAEASSRTIGIAGLTLKDFYMDYRMKNNFIDIPVLSAYTYGGIININSRANLKTEEGPFIINMDIKDIDLHELIKDTKDKDKKIKGLFASKVVLNGYLNKKDSLQGNGWLQVSDGYLWEFPVLHGIMDIILMVPPENIVLTDAFGNFAVNNNRIYTEDFKMLSKAASLLWVGSIGFDSRLDFNITGRFAENVIKQTTEPGRIANAILYQAGNLIMEVRLTGTLKDPIYQIVPFPLKRMFKESIVKGINNIFGSIGE